MALLYELRKRLEKDGLKPPGRLMMFLNRQAKRIKNIHHKRSSFSSPGALMSAMYQDGLLHSLNAVLVYDHLGQTDDFPKEERDLNEILKRMIKKTDPVEVAYYSGRLEIVKRFNARDGSRIPAYFDVGRFKPSHTFRAYKSRRTPSIGHAKQGR